MAIQNFFIFILFLPLISCNNKELYPDKNFSFESKQWSDNTWIRSTDGGIFINDTVDYIHGKQSFCFTNNWLNRHFDSYIYQYILLPIEAKKIEITIFSKSEIIDTALLKIYCLDNKENLISKNSVNIISQGQWGKSILSFYTENTKKIYIEIHAKSKDTILLNKSSKQKLWVDNLQLKINNKSLNSYPPQNNKIATQEIKNKILINPETFKGLEKIEDFTTHRIIALGESVHGSDEIQQTSFQTIKYLIVHEQCKLLLLEIPFEIGLRINDYVLGKTSEDIETLMMFYNYNISNLSMLFNWIRKYNERTQNNIYISGIDMNFPWIRENHLLVYLKNQNIQNDSIKTVLNLIKDHEYKLAVNAIQLLSIEKNTQRCIIHALKYRMHKLDPAASLIEGNRDFIQFENARFAMETWLKKTDKAVIYAHLGHVNKKNSFSSRIYIPNFGNYMQKEYADDYFVIALLVGCGTISNTDSLGWNSELPLVSPPNGSIEDLCLRSGGNLFYKNLSKLNSLNSGRFIGYNYVFNQFYPYSHNGRFDAIIFIKNSHGYQYPQNWPRTKEEILEYFKKDKINEDS